MGLDDLYSPKQQEVLRFAMNHDYFMLINHGAKRSGKTVIDNDLFLHELRRVRQIADHNGIVLPQYILAGSDLGAVQRNILNELTNKYGLEFQFDRINRFKLFGVQVCCFGHSKINDLGRIRGMTAYGAYINEATVANPEVFNEIKSRCSGDGARLLVDTNPDSPSHWLKRDYIDKADGKTIVDFRWKLRDNTFLSKRYIQNIIDTTPSGMYTDRDINGGWVAAAGIVYPDFDRKVHYIRKDKIPEIVRHFVGVDFGWEHPGVFLLIGEGIDGNLYILKEWCKKHCSIDDWIKIGLELEEKYGYINFYCDSARPDLIFEMQRAGLRAIKAMKDVTAGIAEVATLFKTRRLFVVRDQAEEFDKEIDTYAWKEGAEEPVKVEDDVMDAMRYGIYSDKKYGER
ncbi:PBSX family phage terminase large subunit [Lacrimispora sp. NSJ-141]|uniref:PBSX family phage terminase large subunit n=1 Tax=Lientehia hominis TaxID=2897778 RepID=A0AAP2RIR9_9FIRM|nr:PBSX family phage terminase large subunit [Lientehia hominis]MCD2492742.1 PBSX family phage terminase large subunit [Lientehia hominis]